MLNYQRRVPEADLPAFFVPLLVTRLAAEFCIPLTEGSSRAMDLYRLAEAELRSRPADRQPADHAAGVRRFHPDRGAHRMSRAFVTKTSFTAGELDPLLRGRLDLKAQEDGAARLRNVVVHPSGGVSRRPGLRLIASLPGALRLVAFEGTDGGELRGVRPVPPRHPARWRGDPCDHRHAVGAGRDPGPQHRALGRPAAALPPVRAAQGADPQRRVRLAAARLGLRGSRCDDDGQARSLFPFARFVRPEIAIHVNDATGAEIAAGSFVSLLTSEPVFTPDHIDAVIAVKGKHIRIVNPDPVNPQRAYGVALQKLKDGKPTRDWQEQAFSEAHGWPACVAVHQERLVIGGSRDVPDRLWFSKTGHPFNFDPGTGLDDEAISFRLAGDEQHVIRGLLPGRLLQVFTTSGEWVVRGAPITAETVSVELQTRIGSWPGRRLDPVEVDGAALFVGASGRELREFLYAESEQAYQAADIALLSRHLMVEPGGPALRPAPPLAADRARRRQARGGRDRPQQQRRRLEPAGEHRRVPLRRDPRRRAAFPRRARRPDAARAVRRGADDRPCGHARQPDADHVWSGLQHLEGREVVVEGAGPPARRMVVGGAVSLARTGAAGHRGRSRTRMRSSR